MCYLDDMEEGIRLIGMYAWRTKAMDIEEWGNVLIKARACLEAVTMA